MQTNKQEIDRLEAIPVKDIVTDAVGVSDITLTNNNVYFHGYNNATNGIYLRPASGQVKFNITAPYNTLAQAIGLTPEKIKKGVTILGITGTYEG